MPQVYNPTTGRYEFTENTIINTPYNPLGNPYDEMITYKVNIPTATPEKIKKSANRAVTCNICGVGTTINNTTKVGGNNLCESCVKNYTKPCMCCEKRMVGREYRRTALDDYHTDVRTNSPLNYRETPYVSKWMCSKCTDDPKGQEMMWYCNNDGHYYTKDVPFIKASNGHLWCPSCRHALLAKLNTKLDFKANVLDYLEAFPKPVNKYKPQFGIELEVQFELAKVDMHDKIAMVRKLLPNFAICKHDGSLLLRPGWYGFEIVSVPAIVEEHKEQWAKLLAVKHELVSWKTGDCGMHVHISRSALSSLQIGRMLEFINSPDNAKLINCVAGRHSTKYSTILDKKIKDVNYVATGNHDYDRRQALNVMPKNTIELRIFRGNLKPESFFKNLEFSAALVEFCRVCSNVNLTTDKFVSFVIENRHEYPYLYNFFINRDYIAPIIKPALNLNDVAKRSVVHAEFLAKRREFNYAYDAL